MREFHRFISRPILKLIIAGTGILPAAAVLGDTVYVESGKQKSVFPIKNVTINEIRKDLGTESIFYTTESGRTTSKVLDTVVQIEVEGETLFNQAEAEFRKPDLKAAGEDYRKAIKKPGLKDWMKHRCEERLLKVSAQTGDFLGAVQGFVEMARNDPAAATTHLPPIDKTLKPDQLTQAITIVNTGLSNTKPNTKQALYPFLASLYTAAGQTDKAEATIKASKDLGGPTANTGDNSSQLKSAEADALISKAKTAMAANQYDQVIKIITGGSASFVDADRQAAALYLVAQAKDALASGAGSDEAWEDAALAYMRVVAHFKSTPGAPAADALYKTAVIEEKLKKVNEAIVLYNQVINEFKDSKAATDARAAVARLNAGR